MTPDLNPYHDVDLRPLRSRPAGCELAIVDKGSGTFSFIMLDADRADVVRTLRKAASKETFHGAFLPCRSVLAV